MVNSNLLLQISDQDKQSIFECVSQALGVDRQEADAKLELRTHISGPFLNWDLIYRNLMNHFDKSDVYYSETRRGMWTVLLLYFPECKLIVSFMRRNRFLALKAAKDKNRPMYFKSLLTMNSELKAKYNQLSLLGPTEKTNEPELCQVLDELCAGFSCTIETENVHHAVIVFSNQGSRLTSLDAYVLNRDLDIVIEQNWLNHVKPVIDIQIEQADKLKTASTISLTGKSLDRIAAKNNLVSVEKQDVSNDAHK